MSESPRILRDPEVRELTKLSRVQRWRKIRAGAFPAPVRLGPKSVGWIEAEVLAWIAALPRVTYKPTLEPEQMATAQAISPKVR